MKLIGRIFYSVLYTGFIPFAPGTVGALVASFLCYFLLVNNLFSPLILISLTLVSSIIALLVHPQSVAESGSGDPKTFVIDEFAGICATFIWIRGVGEDISLAGAAEIILVGFLLFRFFDIVKPGPIGWIDRQKGGLPVLMDDIVSGLVSCVLVNIYLLLREGMVRA